MKDKKIKISKSLTVFLLITVISSWSLLSSPAPAHSAGAILYHLKEYIINPLVRKIANSLENKIVNKTNQAISGVAGGKPQFILNWRNHILDSQARGNDIFRAVLADTSFCDYFSQDLKKSFGADVYSGAIAGATVRVGDRVAYQNKLNPPGLPSLQVLGRCTLPPGADINRFRRNFENGGWALWEKLVEPQNNIFGAFALALAEQEKQITVQEESAEQEAQAGQGFLPRKLGLGSTIDANGCINTRTPSGISRCIFEGKTITPPYIFSETAANTLDTKLRRVGFGSELTDVILSLIDGVLGGVVGRLTNFTGQRDYTAPPGGDDFDISNIPSTDPNFDAQINQGLQQTENQCLSFCLSVEEPKCDDPDQDISQQCLDNVRNNICPGQCSTNAPIP